MTETDDVNLMERIFLGHGSTEKHLLRYAASLGKDAITMIRAGGQEDDWLRLYARAAFRMARLARMALIDKEFGGPSVSK